MEQESPVRKVIIQVHKIANEMNLPIEDWKVWQKWDEKYGDKEYSVEIYNKLLKPLYKYPSYWGVRVDENDRIVAVKWTKDGEWEEGS